MEKVKSLISIRDEETNYTIYDGEECKFIHIRLRKGKAFALVVNSDEHEFFVPYHVFIHHFQLVNPLFTVADL